MKIWKNVKAYPVLRKKFKKYITGIQKMPEGKSWRKLFWDYLMVRKHFPRSRVSISEYFIFAFYNLTDEEKKAFLTDYGASMRMKRLNAKEKPFLWDKEKFMQEFAGFVSREWIMVRDTDEEGFRAFAEKHGKLALKIPTSSWGIGFKMLDASKVEDWSALYRKLRKQNYLAEELLTSVEELKAFHPSSLNTLRVITFRKDDRFEVFGAGLRVGNKGLHVDNAHGGGIFCEVDVKTGEIITDGLDEFGNVYLEHPMTGIHFRGTVIPKWDEIIEFCRKASLVKPEIRIVGWDVAILEDGRLELIEGNHNPGMNIIQAAAKHGVKYRFDAMIKDFYAKPKEIVAEG